MEIGRDESAYNGSSTEDELISFDEAIAAKKKKEKADEKNANGAVSTKVLDTFTSAMKNRRHIIARLMFALICLSAVMVTIILFGFGDTDKEEATLEEAAMMTSAINKEESNSGPRHIPPPPSLPQFPAFSTDNVVLSNHEWGEDSMKELILANFDSSVHDPAALSWKTQRDEAVALTEERIIQRYALARIYFSFRDDEENSWANENGWLTTEHECRWYGITCKGGGVVTRINLSGNGLEGTLVEGVFDLFPFLSQLNLEGNQISGTIPVQFLQNLTNLGMLQ